MNLWMASQKVLVGLTLKIIRKENRLCHLMQRAIVQNVNIFGTNAQTKTKPMYARNAGIVISNQKKSIYYPSLRIRVGFFFYSTFTMRLHASVF